MIHERGIPRVGARPLQHLYLVDERSVLCPGDRALCGHVRLPSDRPSVMVVGEWTLPDQCVVCADLGGRYL